MSNFEKEAELNRLNNLIEKYQMALKLASVDIVKCIEECVEECSVCPERAYCEAHRHDTIHLDCGDVFLKAWNEEAGLSK